MRNVATTSAIWFVAARRSNIKDNIAYTSPTCPGCEGVMVLPGHCSGLNLRLKEDKFVRLYHYLDAKWALENIRRRRLKISKIDDMNDPYEFGCVRSDFEPSQKSLDETRRVVSEKQGVLCFSRIWNNLLMWSHYGEKHRGICLGFDVPDQLTWPMDYVDGVRVVGDLESFPTGEQESIVHQLLVAKHKGWKYEGEVRMGPRREDRDEETGLYFLGFNEDLKLKEVIAGARFQMSKSPIEEALKGYSYGVEIVKARQSENSFEIVVDERGFRP
jgi:hypothetical protein